MKSAIIVLFFIFSVSCGVNTAESQKRAENSPSPEAPALPVKQAVLVELYTSEG